MSSQDKKHWDSLNITVREEYHTQGRIQRFLKVGTEQE